MSAETIEDLLNLYRTELDFSDDCEVTVEGNPENFTPSYLASLKDIGINRINAGIQTFRKESLEAVNRWYDEERYSRILSDLASSGIKNIGADLIYGLPGQSAESFFQDLAVLAGSGLKHISLYSLTEEEGTLYSLNVKKKLMKGPDEEMQFSIFKALPDTMEKYGFEMYEISNYARPGYACRHNMRYWLYQPYMGLGPGAHGFTGHLRTKNPRNISEYYKQISENAGQYEQEEFFSDLPIGLLRLCLPVRLEWLQEIFSERFDCAPALAAQAAETFTSWSAAGYGRLIESAPQHTSELSAFQWNMKGLLHLDDRILEFSERFDSFKNSAKKIILT